MRRAAEAVLLHAALVAGAVLTLVPLLWMVSASLMPAGEATAVPPRLLPSAVTLEHYRALFTRLDLARASLNSAGLATAVTLIALVVNSMAGYAFAKLRFAGRERLFRLLLAALVVPAQVAMLPLFLMLKELRLVNTYAGVMVPGMASVFGIFLVRQYALSLPESVLDAARIDGAGEFRIYRSLVLYLCAPILVTLAGWTTVASEGARVWTLQEPGHSGMGMRVGFDLGAGGGYVIVHKQLSLPLPENYAFTFYLRGEGRRNNFEFKLLDPTGKNVWWRNQRDFSFPTDWQPVTIRKSRLSLAWGPSKAREPKQVGAIEFAISSGEGGSGSFWIDDLGFEEREPAVQDGVPPDVQASTSLAGHEPPLMLDQDPATGWKSDPVPSTQWVVLDFRKNREYGGFVIDWDPDDYATAFAVQASNDGTQWTTSFATTTGHGGRDYIYLPEAESRFVRLDLQHSSRAQGYGIATLMVKPFSFSASPNDFFAAIARDAPAGTYPKYLDGRSEEHTAELQS